MLTGRLDRRLRKLDNGLVSWSDRPLSEEQFGRLASRLHYSLLLRDEKHDRAVASGSFFDTVRYRKPYLTLRSPFVLHYLNRFPGGGESFDTLRAMASHIRELADGEFPAGDYRAKQDCLEKMASALSLERIGVEFGKQVRL